MSSESRITKHRRTDGNNIYNRSRPKKISVIGIIRQYKNMLHVLKDKREDENIK